MAKVFFGMIISLDGFVNDRNGKFDKLNASYVPTKEYEASVEEIGAVVMGRNSFEAGEDADAYEADYEFQVPLFVLTHNPPAKHPKENDKLTITFVTNGIESAIAQAKAAANGKDVLVMSANVGQQLFRAGLADELQVAIAPILLGTGVRLFEHLEDLEIHLEKVRTIESDQQVEIWFNVINKQELG